MKVDIKEIDVKDATQIWESICKSYKLEKQLAKGNCSIEHANDMQRFNNTKTLFLFLKMGIVSIGMQQGFTPLVNILKEQYNPKNPFFSTINMLSEGMSNYSLAAPAALLGASLFITALYANRSSIVMDESKKFQSFKNELLDIMDIKDNNMISSEVVSNKLHKLYLIGNLTHDSIKTKTVENIKIMIKSLKSLWDEDGIKAFNSISKIIKNFSKFKEASMYGQVLKMNDTNSQINKEYLNNKTDDQDERNNDAENSRHINELNKRTINKAANTYASQNMQIVFARVIQDILKENNPELRQIHKKLLKKFEDLHKVTTLNDNDGERRPPVIMARISKIANDLLENKSHLNNSSRLIDIMKHINPDMVSGNKIKCSSFEKHMMEAKNNIVEPERKNSKKDNFNLNVYQETLINPEDLEEIASINMKKVEKKMKSTKLSSKEAKKIFDSYK